MADDRYDSDDDIRRSVIDGFHAVKARQAAGGSAWPAISTPAHIEELLARINPVRARLIFALDATASRQPTWDLAAQLTAQMFDAVTAIGGLDIQLVYYRGSECTASRWLSDARSLTSIMSRITCASGPTQIGRVLAHARRENQRQKINALILVSDACEENPIHLRDAARGLSDVPVFLFQEGNDDSVAAIYRDIAALTHGACARFDAGAAQRLADLLKAVAAFATGGVKALAAEQTEAATLLLTQVRK